MRDDSFLYQQNGGYFAQVAANLEEEAAAELAAWGAEGLNPIPRGVYFNAEPVVLYRILLQTRLCTRILAPLRHFPCHSTKYLYKTAMALPWEKLLGLEQSFKINARVSDSRVGHSRYAALCLKDAIVDRFQQQLGGRPNVDRRQPDLVFDLHIRSNRAVISLDLAGESLHRRGYRQDSGEAPIQETLAAALVDFSGWDGVRPLVDPFCGSGTILAEALLRRANIPPGQLRRRFGLHNLPDFSPPLWRQVREEADAARQTLPAGLLAGSDQSKKAVHMARRNLARLPQGDQVALQVCPLQALPPINNAVIVTNPPYGIRLGDQAAAVALVRELGSFLKHHCTGSTACLYFGDPRLLKEIGLKPSRKKKLNNGGLEGVAACYEMY
ncbi:THUMP domain-containing class I SAM-dependent RNA methyltransferase [Desulfurivibrio dismutans]|uniref:THUMP domain-containing class I SAM-dependent RNA methyltransferase n=1 Tax=Desulfurivibrio dismutans TaxID=1398908 RepID=UPI0023D98353|nr:THUMP domain-containing protein [Desulfurivibrio alkaliphilus]MDF1614238.1 THUMP domain-containing protein [Desulfurivibrio alkaliphilus]